MKNGRRNKKLSVHALAAIITSAVAVALIAALLILNAFIPVRYLTAYTVKSTKNRVGELRVTFIDVDFGESILLELPDGKTALIDGGDGAYPNQMKLLKTLNSRGIDRIDYLVCTSVKKEHCGGLKEILQYKDVRSAFIPYAKNVRLTEEYHAFITALEQESAEKHIACVGEGFNGENYFFTFLSPSSYVNPESEYSEMNAEPDKENIDNASAVGWLECGGIKFAFTSDARGGALERVVGDYSAHKALGEAYCPYAGRSVELENCSVVTVAGHGGEKNAYSPWYDMLKPAHAVVSVGKNYGGYPSAIALSDPIGVGAKLYFTNESGNVTFTVNGGGLGVAAER